MENKNKNKMTSQERKSIFAMFRQLAEECRIVGTYLVSDASSRLNIDYNKIQEWAERDDHFLRILNECKSRCLNNIERALLEDDIEWEKAVRDGLENAYEGHEHREYYLKELDKIEREKGTKANIMITKKQETTHVKEATTQEVMQNEIPATFCDDQLMHDYRKERDTAEQNRIRDWRLKGAKKESRVEFEVVSAPEKEPINIQRTVKRGKKLSSEQKDEIISAETASATGSGSVEFSHLLLTQTANAFVKSDGYKPLDAFNAIYKTLVSMQPSDEFEAMLISRTLALHNQYMHYMQLAAHTTNQDSRDRHINNATKLMRVYNESLEALNKHRRKGEQKVTVQHNHVNVNDGGKAIVGSEIGGSGDRDKK